MKKKVALFGGAFNPPTLGHIHACETVLAGVVDEVRLLPCYEHNFGKQLIPADYRLRMCEISTRENNRIVVDDFCIANQTNGKIFDELEHYTSDPKNCDEYYILIGLDNALTIDSWYRGVELRNKYKFIVMERFGDGLEDDFDIHWFNFQPHLYIQSDYPGECSSTEVRRAFQFQDLKLIAEKMDMETAIYAAQNKLYH